VAGGPTRGLTAPSAHPKQHVIMLMDARADLFAYATQISGTATFWNRCGIATAEDG
jgi:hypothetical protein